MKQFDFKRLPTWMRSLFDAFDRNDAGAVKQWVSTYTRVDCSGVKVLDAIAKRERDGSLSDDVVALVAAVQWEKGTTAREKVALLKKIVEREEQALKKGSK